MTTALIRTSGVSRDRWIPQDLEDGPSWALGMPRPTSVGVENNCRQPTAAPKTGHSAHGLCLAASASTVQHLNGNQWSTDRVQCDAGSAHPTSNLEPPRRPRQTKYITGQERAAWAMIASAAGEVVRLEPLPAATSPEPRSYGRVRASDHTVTVTSAQQPMPFPTAPALAVLNTTPYLERHSPPRADRRVSCQRVQYAFCRNHPNATTPDNADRRQNHGRRQTRGLRRQRRRRARHELVRLVLWPALRVGPVRLHPALQRRAHNRALAPNLCRQQDR